MTEIEQIFVKILNMSLNAGLVVVVILFLRHFFKKIPKKYSYLLWIIVFLRFLWPFTVESVVSLLPAKSDPITYEKLANVMPYTEPAKSANRIEIENMDNINTPNFDEGNGTIINHVYPTNRPNYVLIASLIWVIIGLLLLSVSIIKLGKLLMKLRTATLAGKPNERIYETDQISSPFIIGIIHPCIYIPVGLSDQEKYHIVKHEQMHGKRKDYLVKLAAFFAVLLHWFNPLVWLSFYLLIKDMEMSCDELVLAQTREDIRLDYSQSLLSFSMKQSGLLSPLAFGESNTKSRVRNILRFRKPSSWVSIVAIVLVLLTAVTLLTNSKQVSEHKPQVGDFTLADELYKNRTPYIGDNSKVLALIYELPVPEGLKYNSIELQTKTQPYELHVYYESDLDNEVYRINNNMEYKNAVLLFATIENMDKYTIHRTVKGGESRLTYTRSEIEESIGDLYSYSESPEDLERLILIVDDYLDGVHRSGEAEK